jgi:hypothetical protein
MFAIKIAGADRNQPSNATYAIHHSCYNDDDDIHMINF